MTLSLLGRLKAAHTRTGAPGQVVRVNEHAGRYLVDVYRADKPAKRLAYRYETKADNRVTVKPCWTTHTPDGKAIQHRRSATE